MLPALSALRGTRLCAEIADEQSLTATAERRLTWTETAFGEFVCEDGSSIAPITE